MISTDRAQFVPHRGLAGRQVKRVKIYMLERLNEDIRARIFH